MAVTLRGHVQVVLRQTYGGTYLGLQSILNILDLLV